MTLLQACDRVVLVPQMNNQTSNLLKVVYDVDNVLWPLNRRVFARLKIDWRKDTTYNVLSNPNLTVAERQAVLDIFHQADTFAQIRFFPDAKDILQVESLGATVRIHSHCYTADIAQSKFQQLRQLLPAIKPAFIKMTIISHDPNHKQIDADAFVFVDDNPYNIITSKAPVNIVPRQPWNTTPEAAQVLTSGRKVLVETGWQAALPELISRHQRCAIMAENLREVNQIVQQAVKIKQEVKHGEF